MDGMRLNMYSSEFGCESDLAFSKCIGGDYESPIYPP